MTRPSKQPDGPPAVSFDQGRNFGQHRAGPNRTHDMAAAAGRCMTPQQQMGCPRRRQLLLFLAVCLAGEQGHSERCKVAGSLALAAAVADSGALHAVNYSESR